MNITANLKKSLKKAGMPVAKRVRRIADASIAEYEPSILKRYNDLKTNLEALSLENSRLKSDLSNLEANSNYIYYYHGGSGNHGCEALVRTITNVCNIPREELCLYSYRPDEDRQFGLTDIASVIRQSSLNTDDISVRYRTGTIAFSIGGDNYCNYPNPRLGNCNRHFHQSGAKTALIGCSIEPDIIKHADILGDLCQYDLITARESITYNALIENGITKNTQLIPDSAFTLAPQPSGIELPKNTVGLNVSGITLDAAGDLMYQNTIELIKYILEKTKYHIALIPHVHQNFNDDYDFLQKIYAHFLQDSRITLISTELNAPQLKDVISQCSLLVAARTHCSVAGYSTNVPTLVLGYSVKSIGIAQDIFGTSENYVKSVYGLKNQNEFKKAFIWLDDNQTKIRKHLQSFMPGYIKKAYELQKHISLLNSPSETLEYHSPTKPAQGTYISNTLSIITSCYNSEAYLYRYLDSLLRQTNHNIQLIIVNDGSTDHTEEIIFNYKPVLEKHGIQVVYLKQQNTGISGAYNLALPYVSGEYFCWCDSDNFYAPNFVETILEFFEEHSNANILRHDGYMITEDNSEDLDIFTKTNFPKFSNNSPKPYEKHLFMNAILEKNWHFGNIVLRTSAFDKIQNRKIYPSRYGQNWQLCLPMLYHYEAHYIPDTLFYFVIRKSSVSHQNARENDNSLLFLQFDGYKQILKEVLNDINPTNLDELLKILDQKYICRKLAIAKETNNENDIATYTKLFDEQVAPNNLYQAAIAKL